MVQHYGGLVPVAEFLNHAADPSAEWEDAEAALQIRAARNLAPGDEVTITYGSCHAPREP